MSQTIITAYSQLDIDVLNTKCPCGGSWVVNVTRTFTICPDLSCTGLEAETFTFGIPVGSKMYGSDEGEGW